MTAIAGRERRWLAPEVVQTSAMDCGPAALKCVLEGFHVSVSYGRLREACQTDVDGTSIDALESVAGQLGIEAEQVMLPPDHLVLETAQALPALVVVRHAELSTHFVVVWRRLGPWLQVMDPARGRRWVTARAFQDELFRHSLSVPAQAWRAWAATEGFTAPLAERMAALGVPAADARALIADALADDGWFSMGALDAAVRLAASLEGAGGLAAGGEAMRLVRAIFEGTCASPDDIYAMAARDYWCVEPDRASREPGGQRLLLKGMVLLTLRGARGPSDPGLEEPPLSRELAAALAERPETPLRAVWGMLRADGVGAPLVLAGAMALASCVLMVEALLFRGIFDISDFLRLPGQRLGASVALMAFCAILLAVEIPVVVEALRIGRRIEVRFRTALLAKLPRLNDRYFQSRPITDMADRSHSIHVVRNLPSIALQFVQASMELALTLGGVLVLDPAGSWLAVGLVVFAMAVPLLTQPMLNERDLRVRNHAAALHGFYLDALLGLAPIRAHRAERSVSLQHEGLLVEWAQALRGSIVMAMSADAVQAVFCTAMGGLFLYLHFARTGAVSGSDLLLIFWVLKLPALGARIAGLTHQYPAHRNALLRLMEPLAAPEDPEPAAPVVLRRAEGPVSVAIESASVVASGHEILRDLDLQISAGEHVAVVGPSGAGKSSLVGVLLGWRGLASGRLRLDGVEADGAAVEALRRTCAWVDPAIQIWNRSLLENLEYASEAPALGRMGEVVEAARLRGVAEKLPRGLQTLLGEGGGLISGGEGQRVRLGRALAMEAPRLVLLDEPFRGLDRGQRRTLLAEARAWWKDVTLLCVTHDVGETLAFERVLVVEDGRIVEDGAPARLARSRSRYRRLLEAEREIQRTFWGDGAWRRLRMDEGRLVGAEGEA